VQGNARYRPCLAANPEPSEVDVRQRPVPVRIASKVLRGGDLCLFALAFSLFPRPCPGDPRIFLDGQAANVVQIYTVHVVGTKFAHD